MLLISPIARPRRAPLRASEGSLPLDLDCVLNVASVGICGAIVIGGSTCARFAANSTAHVHFDWVIVLSAHVVCSDSAPMPRIFMVIESRV